MNNTVSDDDNVVHVIPGDRRKVFAYRMRTAISGSLPGETPKVAEPHKRHQGEKERARRQKQKDRIEAKAMRRAAV
jgi:hypothetical protein